MKMFLEAKDLTARSIRSFVRQAVRQDEIDVLFLLGKANAYVDVGYCLGQVTLEEARQLFDIIDAFLAAQCNTI